MEWSKVKNIIILILLLVNGFLLILIVGQRQRSLNYEKAALTRAAQVLEQNGIAVSDEALTQAAAGSLPPMTATRDTDKERSIATALLGEDTICTDQSGGLYAYSGTDGTAIFRANGNFTITLFAPPSGLDDAGARAYSDTLLQSMGIEGEFTRTDGQHLVYRQLLDEAPLYNCEITFEYQDGSLLAIQGTLLTCRESLSAVEESESLSVSTALIRFLDGILDRRDLCSAITALRPGYLSTQSFGATTLTPVWLVSTNISDYYLNGITGALSPVA